MDLLLDVNAVVDVCAGREPFAATIRRCMGRCRLNGGRLWVYAGSVQTLHYVLTQALQRGDEAGAQSRSTGELSRQALALLGEFTRETQWLGALSAEGDVLDAEDPEDAQLARALDRFPEGSIRLLTRDRALCRAHPDRAITPEDFLGSEPAARGVDFIDLKAQQDTVRGAMERGIHQVLHHGKYIMGPEVQCLEARLAEYVGVEHCLGVASGTDALLVALMALGVGHGDEVITTPFSFIATAETIALLGAVAVFVDIDPRTCNLDPGGIEAAITPRTRAIMPVSLYGQCADMDAINAVAERHGLPVIEDGAQSFGATYKGRRSCGLTTIGCTSFFPSKPLGGYGDGGACFTDDPELATAMHQVRLHGQDRRYHHARVGINGRLDTLQAGILLAKLDAFPAEVEARGRIGAAYTGRLQDLDCVTPFIEPHNTSVYAQYTLQVDDRQGLAEALKAEGVPTAVHYPETLDHQPALEECGRAQGDLAHARAAAERVISLPMHPYLDDATLERVVAAVARHLA